ncbi:MAG: CDC27 family protein [Flavobacteriales bacterium]
MIALQAYCIYHLFKNRNPYYWVFVILFLPLIGSIIYLITQVYNKRDADKLQDNLVSIINPTKRIKDLEKKLQFSETYQNRVNLADAYLENKDYKNAIPHYLNALHDNLQNDSYAIKQLIECYYYVGDFDNVIFYVERIKDNSEFQKSKSQFFYGLALEKLGKLDEAETNLKQIDIRYSFYEERFILAKFLLNRDKKEEAKAILDDIYMESQNMTKQNQRIYRNTIIEVEKLKNSL